MKPNDVQPNVPKLRSALLLALVLSLTACATPNAPQLPPQLPARPSLSEPTPSTPYSDHVRLLLSNWAELLTPTPQTQPD